jgi:sigma-B regulation protein RsbU (phosphoserine phosphatase)
MLRDFALENDALVAQLAQQCAGCGWTPYLVADAEGAVACSWGRSDVALPSAAELAGREPPAEGWIVAPVHDYPDRTAGFIGLRAPASERAPARATLESQAMLLQQFLSRERELNDIAAELVSAYDQLVAMYRVSEITRSNLDLDAILRALLAEGVRLSQARHGFVIVDLGHAVEGPAGRRCIVHDGGPDGCAGSGAIIESHQALAEVLFRAVRQWGHTLVCNTPSNLDEVLPQATGTAQRCLIAPVSLDDQIVAALGLTDKETFFSAGDRKLLSALADEVGGIIERAGLQAQLIAQERMRRELEIAAEIQMGLLPETLPAIPGLDIAARCSPANEVGGDFYDILDAPDHPLGIVLGDVTSKGVPAALFVTVAHTVLNGEFAHAASPRALLERLNAAMYQELTRSAMFITLLIAYYDAERRRLTMANAGHSPVLLYRAQSGRCRLCEADGPPVGVLPDVLSMDQVVDLDRGDVLVVMSDGFNETANPAGEMFGIARLIKLVEEQAGQSAARIQECLFEAVRRFADGAPQADDLTICVLKWGSP